jgi:hypothetical protein
MILYKYFSINYLVNKAKRKKNETIVHDISMQLYDRVLREQFFPVPIPIPAGMGTREWEWD